MHRRRELFGGAIYVESLRRQQRVEVEVGSRSRSRSRPSVTDYFEKEVAPKEALRPVLWKPGFLYAQRFVVLHRVGEERYRGFFTTGDGRLPPRPTTGENLELFTLN
jgi:hypothetical protein